jgi:hypothetical protein
MASSIARPLVRFSLTTTQSACHGRKGHILDPRQVTGADTRKFCEQGRPAGGICGRAGA